MVNTIDIVGLFSPWQQPTRTLVINDNTMPHAYNASLIGYPLFV